MISNGSMSGLAQRHAAHVRSSPTSPLAAISADEDVRPAAPRSCNATSSPRSSSSSEHSSSFFSSNGSPICTVGRLSSESSSSARASTDAPPMPSRPVRAPNSTSDVADARGGGADQLVGLDQADAIALTRQFCSYGPSK